jgi:hypothetical protein
VSSGAILAFLLALPVYQADRAEPSSVRAERLQEVADAIEAAVDRATCPEDELGEPCQRRWPLERADELRALLVAVAWHESRLAEHVQRGRCRPWECGGRGRDGLPRARGPWQVERSPVVPAELWRAIDGGPGSTVAAAEAAVRVLSACRGGPRATLLCYAGGHLPREGLGARLRTYWRARAALAEPT